MSQTARVGLFAILTLAVLAFLIIKVEDLNLFGGPGQRIDVIFDSVAGLDDRAPVRVAGVRVGRVDGIRLDGQRARVTLLLETPLKIKEGAYAAVSNMGLLGDKYVEIIPGNGPGDWPEGEPLPGLAPVSIDRAIAKLESIGGSIEGVLGGLSAGKDGGGFGRLLDELSAASSSIRELVEANKNELTTTVGHFESVSETLAKELPRLAEQMQLVLAEIGDVVGENRGDIRESMVGLKELSGKVQITVDNLNAITEKLASGEGSMGKLLQSDEAHDSLTATLTSVREGVESLETMLDRTEKIKVDLAMQTAYISEFEEYRSEFMLELDPQRNRFYRLGLVKDPRGKTRRTRETITTTHDDGTTSTEVVESLIRSDKATITGLFGFGLSDKSRLWTGLIENEFGLEADLRLAKQRFKLSLEAFDFNREFERDPHLRFTGNWRLHPNFFILGGWDDPLVDEFSSVFLGAGVRWNDDDLKYLLGSALRF